MVIMPDRTARAGHDVAPASRAQNFVHVFLKRHIARDGRDIAGHDVLSPDAGERASDRHLREALLRRAQQEPPDERRPQPADPVAIQRLPDANEDHEVGK